MLNEKIEDHINNIEIYISNNIPSSLEIEKIKYQRLIDERLFLFKNVRINYFIKKMKYYLSKLNIFNKYY